MIEWLIEWLNGLLTVYWFIEWYRCNKCTTPIHFFNNDQWSFVLQLNAVWQFDNTELVEQLPKWRETTNNHTVTYLVLCAQAIWKWIRRTLKLARGQSTREGGLVQHTSPFWLMVMVTHTHTQIQLIIMLEGFFKNKALWTYGQGITV